MPHEQRLVAETRSWFAKAEEDLYVADLCLTSRRGAPATVAYHSQQAAEKAIKGFLTWHQRSFPKTHLLLEVAEPCWRIDPTLKPVLEFAIDLSAYAWKYRYPGESADPTRAEAQEAIRLAQAVFSAILERLPAEVRPY